MIRERQNEADEDGRRRFDSPIRPADSAFTRRGRGRGGITPVAHRATCPTIPASWPESALCRNWGRKDPRMPMLAARFRRSVYSGDGLSKSIVVFAVLCPRHLHFGANYSIASSRRGARIDARGSLTLARVRCAPGADWTSTRGAPGGSPIEKRSRRARLGVILRVRIACLPLSVVTHIRESFVDGLLDPFLGVSGRVSRRSIPDGTESATTVLQCCSSASSSAKRSRATS
jgi:hypothetical protein